MQEALQKISVIIPVYNVEKYLPQCLESVCGQTYRELEIILVDDGSKDRSGEICDEWSRKDPRIKVIHKKNGGVSSARNEGLKAAKGPLIGFVDADDWLRPEMYEKLAAALAADSAADAVFCGYVDYPKGNMDLPVEKGVTPLKPCTPLPAAHRVYEHNGYFTSLWNKLFRRRAVEKDGRPFMMDTDLSWGEDEVWLARVIMNCRRIIFVPEAFYYWRPTAKSVTRDKSVSDRQMTLLTAKQRAMKILPGEKNLQRLMKARMFNDCYSMKVLAYDGGDREKFRKISGALSEMKTAWLLSRDPSLFRKMKVFLMEAEMALRLPGKLVRMTDNVRSCGIIRNNS